MNALTKLIREAKNAAMHDLRERGDDEGQSFPIRLRSGDTLIYHATIGPRGGVKIHCRRHLGWIVDHPADFGAPSY